MSRHDNQHNSLEPTDILDSDWKSSRLNNIEPTVYNTIDSDDDDVNDRHEPDEYCDDVRNEVYSLIRYIRDPEHPYTLEELHVVRRKYISVQYHDNQLYIQIEYIPTVPHCSLATLIGLCIRCKIISNFDNVKLDITVLSGSHSTSDDINRQLNDKERACAAMENPPLRDTVYELINNNSQLKYNE